MRLHFSDWKMEGGVVTERRASCGPLQYHLLKYDKYLFVRCGGPTADAINDSDGKTASFADYPAAESACESHLQAILDAAKESDAFKPCAKCGKPVSTLEDGSPGVELRDGRWACSESCWDALVGPPTTPKDHPNA